MIYMGRLFFRKDTGNLLYWYEMEGDIVVSTIEQDLNSIKPLANYTPESVLVVELEQTDYATREKARNAKGIKYNLATGQVVFNLDPGTQEDIEKRISLEERVSALEQITADIAEMLLEKGVI
ncbi:MAG: hypothetical protein GX996_08210 [Firmicutes bacterium]|nr:hypothetical protein [Bacillota bacterium]